MALFENFPYTNMHEINLDWIIKIIENFKQQYPQVITEINNKLDKAINGNGAFGDILTSNGDGTVSWTSSKDIDPEIIADAVFEWLDEHPEATTTVEDGSITEAKLAWDLNKQIKANTFVDNIHLRTGAFITSEISGQTAVQGMCCINNRYLVLCRYYNSTQRAFRVYDIINKSFVNESILNESQVGHVNSMAYSNGYIYVATLTENMGIVRLTVNLSTFVIAFDTIVSPDLYVDVSIYEDNIFAWRVPEDDTKWHCYKLSPAFDNPVSLFSTDFLNNMDHMSMQGGDADDKYIYISVSGSYENGDMAANGSNPPTRYTEYIYIFSYDGTLIKTFNLSRGKYGEIEDIAIITVSDQKYIAITFNRNDFNVANIFISPLFSNSGPINQFMTTDIENSVFKVDTTDVMVFVSGSTGTEFADGTENKPFKTINAALSFIMRANIPCSLVLKDGNFGLVIIHNISTPLTIYWNGGTTANIFIRRCGPIVFDRTALPGTTVTGYMTIDEAIINSRGGPDFNAPVATANAIRLNRSIFIGSLAGNITNYTNALYAINSFILATIDSGVMGVTGTAHGWMNNNAL